MDRYESWFGVGFEFLLYDVTSTYFEDEAKGNLKTKGVFSRQTSGLQTGEHWVGRDS